MSQITIPRGQGSESDWLFPLLLKRLCPLCNLPPRQTDNSLFDTGTHTHMQRQKHTHTHTQRQKHTHLSLLPTYRPHRHNRCTFCTPPGHFETQNLQSVSVQLMRPRLNPPRSRAALAATFPGSEAGRGEERQTMARPDNSLC